MQRHILVRRVARWHPGRRGKIFQGRLSHRHGQPAMVGHVSEEIRRTAHSSKVVGISAKRIVETVKGARGELAGICKVVARHDVAVGRHGIVSW